MGHHVEMIHFLGDKRGIGLHIDQGEVLAGMVDEYVFPPKVKLMGGVGMHLLT